MKNQKAMWRLVTLLIIAWFGIIPSSFGQTLVDASTEQESNLTLNEQALKLVELGKYMEAKNLLKRALAIERGKFGKENLNIATIQDNLGRAHEMLGEYKEAEPLYQHSLAIFEKELGNEHQEVAGSLNNLATVYLAQGKYNEARPLLERSIAILGRPGEKNPNIFLSLNNLAVLHKKQGNYKEAELLYQRSIAMVEKEKGKDSRFLVTNLSSLAALYTTQGNYEKAKPLLERALAIGEKKLGADHPTVATGLNNLAKVYLAQRNYEEAKILLERALAIGEKKIGVNHPDSVTGLNNLAEVYLAQRNYEEATKFLSQGLIIEEKLLSKALVIGSERNNHDYINNILTPPGFSISLAFQSNYANSQQLALTSILIRQGRVLDTMADTIKIIKSRLKDRPDLQKIFDDWRDILQQQSSLIDNNLSQKNPAEYEVRNKILEKKKQQLETQLSAKSAIFRQTITSVPLENIQALIPKNTSLIQIIKYRPFNPKEDNESGLPLLQALLLGAILRFVYPRIYFRSIFKKLMFLIFCMCVTRQLAIMTIQLFSFHESQWGEPHYAAAILNATSTTHLVDLGPANTIEKNIQIFRQHLQDGSSSGNTQSTQIARTLHQQLIQPLRPYLGNTQHLLLSPDSTLNLIPFEALQDQNNQYLIESYAISYLTSGRDLLRFRDAPSHRQAPVIFSEINYGQSNNTAQNRFGSLDTAAETKQIPTLFKNAQVFRGLNATKAALQKVAAPQILHLATHGYFKPASPNQNNTQIDNPLLRSGIILAGANKTNATSASILTGLETSTLDLYGTQLVVLSACETGLGDIYAGEGIYGLRRALVLAGAQSQILSLWKVEDKSTSILMNNFYQNLSQGQGRHEALRQAQLKLLKSANYNNPHYWAAFIPSGNWQPLSR